MVNSSFVPGLVRSDMTRRVIFDMPNSNVCTNLPVKVSQIRRILASNFCADLNRLTFSARREECRLDFARNRFLVRVGFVLKRS